MTLRQLGRESKIYKREDDESVHGVNEFHFRHDIVELDEELSVCFVWTAAGKCPTLLRQILVEGSKNGLFDVVGYLHIILNRI